MTRPSAILTALATIGVAATGGAWWRSRARQRPIEARTRDRLLGREAAPDTDSAAIRAR